MLDDLLTYEIAYVSGLPLCRHLTGVTLKVPMGEFPAGTRFLDAMVDFDDGILTLGTGNEDYPFKMEVTVRPEV